MYRMLHERYPYAHCELDFDTPLQLLVATVLSAQTTDVTVNKVTPTLFARWPTAPDLAAADRTEMEEVLRPTGFYRAKTNSVLKLASAIVEEHDGEVPPRLADLVKLPGVGRKTANVVLGNAFGIPASPSTPTSVGWPAAWGGPTRRTRSRSSTRSARSSRARSGRCSATW